MMKQVATSLRSGRKGDVVAVSGHQVGERERLGEILEALGEADHMLYRVRWDDGSESVFFPGSDATIRRSPAGGVTKKSESAAVSASALTNVLQARDVSYEMIPHRRTESAAAEARAIGIDPGQVAKTIVLTAGAGFVRAVVSASERIDLGKAKAILGSGDVHLASEQVLADAYQEFELGAVPPVGGPVGDLVLVDEHLRDTELVVFEAGTHDHSVRVKTADLISVAEARFADICED
jgi:Ala-tRNA(Pro) deacylase